MNFPRLIFLVLLGPAFALPAQADDREKLAALFAPATTKGGVVTIPPGDYSLDGREPIQLSSNTTVIAQGARFHLPAQLGDQARLVLFAGDNVRQFSWHGGEFFGHVFDPAQRENAWEPNVCTRVFLFTTTRERRTSDILFRDVRSDGIAGAVVTVLGAASPENERDVLQYAERVTLDNCTFLRSGKFMWDYGFLWQQIVWPDDYEPWEVARAKRYFRNDLVRESVRMADQDDKVQLDNRARPIEVSRIAGPKQSICFCGSKLPKNIVRGKHYFVVACGPDFLQISESLQGPPIRFQGSAGEGTALIHDLHSAFLALYAPTNAGPGKGAFDLVACRDVRVTDCRLSALGDTMHIQRSRNIVFANNQILGSRMGAFFLAEYCQNATITGNTVDGTNGSRVMSVEKSCEDVTIVGNIFRGGGRGSWINQPKNLVLQGNLFVGNTTKGTADPRRGRRSWKTGDWEKFPEIYFTLHEPNGRYGPVLLQGNTFQTQPEAAAAIHFERNGDDLLLEGNLFRGATGRIFLDEGTKPHFGANPGAKLEGPAAGKFGNP